MKNFLTQFATFLVIVASLVSMPGVANALALSASPALLELSVNNVSVGDWVTLFTSTAKSSKALCISNTGPTNLKVGIAAAGSAVNSEVMQLAVPSMASGSAGQCYPIVASGSARVSILSFKGNASTGTVAASVIYN